jgi:hypothetical protein
LIAGLFKLNIRFDDKRALQRLLFLERRDCLDVTDLDGREANLIAFPQGVEHQPVLYFKLGGSAGINADGALLGLQDFDLAIGFADLTDGSHTIVGLSRLNR